MIFDQLSTRVPTPLTKHFCSALLNRPVETPEVTGTEEAKAPEPPKRTSLQAAMAGGIASVFGGGEEKKEKDKPRFSISAVDNLLPRIKRGFTGEEEKDEAMVVGWKAEVRSRKEREEVLR
jgi:hypothetical protein